MAKKEVTIEKGVKVPRGTEEKMRKVAGSSDVGKYKKLAPKEFAGPSGNSEPGSFPINNLKHARDALSRAHFAPDPAGIRRAVYKKYPELKMHAEERAPKKK